MFEEKNKNPYVSFRAAKLSTWADSTLNFHENGFFGMFSRFIELLRVHRMQQRSEKKKFSHLSNVLLSSRNLKQNEEGNIERKAEK